MRVLFLAAALLCASTALASASTVSINGWDPGGEISTYAMWWKRIAATGDTVRVNGACVSACSFMLGMVPASHVCVTPRAKFGIHLASINDRPNRRLTRQVQRQYYPAWVNAWIKTQPKLTAELTWLDPRVFRAHFKTCR